MSGLGKEPAREKGCPSMSTKMGEFFDGLSERMWKENDLSDVTYAMCVGNVEFRQFFLNFFFSEEKLCATEVDISREWCDGEGNRPDFCIRNCDGQYYFVEVKLWDGNLHFDSYRDGLKILNNLEDDNIAVKHLAYVAAYKIDKKSVSGCNSAHTWYEFWDGLKSLSFLNDDMISGYCTFVYAVAGLQDKEQAELDVKEYNNFKVSDFVQVRQFMASLDKAIDSASSKGVVAYNGSSRCFSRGCRMGRFFEITNFKDGHSVWGWIGAYYNYGDAEICVWFEDRPGWGELVCDKFRDRYSGSKPADGTWYCKTEGGHLYFYMLDSDNDVSAFFNRVLAAIQSDDVSPSRKLDNDEVKKKYKPLLSMRQFPLWIERNFFNDIQASGYDVILDAGGDSEDPYNHCGRYFTVEKREKDSEGKRQQIKGWIGVLFGENEGAATNPRIEMQFLRESGRYECVNRLGEIRHDMASIASEFRDALAEYCKNGFAKK